MEARANLRLVGDSASDVVWPETGELLSPTDATHRIRDLLDRLDGYKRTCDKQAREIGALSRRVAEDEDPNSHPLGKEIVELVDYWRRQTGHLNAKVSADRVKLIKARLADGYDPDTVALAIDGIAIAPFVVNAQRQAHGKESQRYDQLKHALKGGQELERFANLGYRARKQGRIEGDWRNSR